MKIIVISLLGFLVTTNLFAKNEIHVAVDGSDQGNGTLTSPYQTLNHAFKHLQHSDVLYIHEGTYPENNLVLKVSGEENNPLTITSYKDDKVIILGKEKYDGDLYQAEYYGTLPSILDIRNAQFIEVSNLEFASSQGMGVSIWNSQNITVKNCLIHHIWSRGLGGNGKNLSFVGNEVFQTSLQNANEQVLHDRARGLIHYWSAGTASWFLPNGDLSENILWQGNSIHDNWGEGLIALHVNGAVIDGNTIYNNYSNLIYVDHSRNVVIKNNNLKNTSNAYYRTDAQYIAPAIMLASEHYSYPAPTMTENVEIFNNTIENTSVGVGFWRDPDNTSPLNRYKSISIHHNHFKSITVIPFTFRRINTDFNEAITNFFFENIVESDLPWRFENPEIWSITK